MESGAEEIQDQGPTGLPQGSDEYFVRVPPTSCCATCPNCEEQFGSNELGLHHKDLHGSTWTHLPCISPDQWKRLLQLPSLRETIRSDQSQADQDRAWIALRLALRFSQSIDESIHDELDTKFAKLTTESQSLADASLKYLQEGARQREARLLEQVRNRGFFLGKRMVACGCQREGTHQLLQGMSFPDVKAAVEFAGGTFTNNLRSISSTLDYLFLPSAHLKVGGSENVKAARERALYHTNIKILSLDTLWEELVKAKLDQVKAPKKSKRGATTGAEGSSKKSRGSGSNLAA